MQSVRKINASTYMLKVDIPIASLKYVNSYAIQSKDNTLLIDTGWNNDSSLNSFLRNISFLNLDINKIKHIIITHFHIDHLGLSLKIRELANASLYIHERDREYIINILKDVEKSIENFRETLIKVGAPAYIYQNLENFSWIRWIKFFERFIDVSESVKDNETIKHDEHELELIWTPGHTPGHICIYDRNDRVLFSGDHILPSISSNISAFDFKINPLEEYIGSLNKISNLEVSTVLPAHEYEYHNLKGRIMELKMHHHNRLKEIIEAIKKGRNSPYEIASQISWKLGGKKWNDVDPFQKYMALGETISHLIFLKSKGIIKEEENFNSIKYFINKEIKEEDIKNLII